MTSKVHSTTDSTPHSILYVATTVQAAEDGAAALEGVQTGGERTVQPTTSIDRLRDRSSAVDCVVLETDSATAKAHADLLEAAGSTPVVVFGEGPYAESALHGDVDGFVRRDTADAHVHLVDELERVSERELAAETHEPDTRSTATVYETTADLAACRERDALFEELVEGAVDVLEFDHCWLATINFGELVPRAAAPAVPEQALDSISLENPLGVAFRAREPIRIADLANYEWIEPPFDGARSLCSVPVSDVGVLHVAAESPNAFEGADLALIEGLCAFATTILERNWAERGLVNERDRLRREREEFHEHTTQLEDERDALFTLFRDVAEPTLRYDVDGEDGKDGEPVVSGVNAPFEAVFDADREAIVGESVAAVALSDGLSAHATTLADAIRGTERQQFDVRRATPDGVRDFQLTVVPLAATDGADASRSGGLLVYEDVTQQQRRERELAAATRRLEAIGDRIDDDVRDPLNTARGYLELAEKTGDEEHFRVVEDAHEQLSDRLQALVDVADGTGDTEPISLSDAATRAWINTPTVDARLLTQEDRLIEADREAVETVFEYIIQTTIEIEGDDATDTVTVTVGGTDDGFYIAGSRPTNSSEGDPDPDRIEDTDGSAFELEFIEQVANAHGWDVGIAEDDDGTAVAFRGVDTLE